MYHNLLQKNEAEQKQISSTTVKKIVFSKNEHKLNFEFHLSLKV